ncbi:phosphate/phosphite/phosphonate ABC transporter substrate-binding protein [Aquibaculum sediminis]|uniref:phosphate/phosphite/phosphonate ABC transporter substrate-binding protein n=1 Tax=Aquibaculum sediminis TaxID=3231907 RepID=UPI0034565AFC
MPERRSGGLPMYDLPELVAQTDAWWLGLVRHLEAAGLRGLPERPCRPDAPEELWLAQDLAVTQTCGYPLTNALAGRVRYVATPCYDAPGCEGAWYRSAILVCADARITGLADLKGHRAALNDWHSQSGMNALRHSLLPHAGTGPFFRDVRVTGSHRASLAALRAGEADVAAVDCVTLALLKRCAPAETEGLCQLAWSAPAPGLPLITRATADAAECAALRRGLATAFADPALAPLRGDLGLAGMDVLPLAAYDVIPAMAQAAPQDFWG